MTAKQCVEKKSKTQMIASACMVENRTLRILVKNEDMAVQLDREYSVMASVAKSADWNEICLKEMVKIWERLHAVVRDYCYRESAETRGQH